MATAVTNFDIHDIARCARTYGVGGFFVITPLESQMQLVERIVHHWMEGAGSTYNPTRGESLSLIRVSRTIDEAEQEISRLCKGNVEKVATGASPHPNSIGFGALRQPDRGEGQVFLHPFRNRMGIDAGGERALRTMSFHRSRERDTITFQSARPWPIILDRLLGERC